MKKLFWLGISVCASLIAGISAPLEALEQNPEEKIFRANNLYANKQYQEAADAYENLISQGFHNGYLYYNLGNTYVRLEKPGPAILNYIRAKKLIPRDEALEANLRYAVQETKDQLEPGSGGFLTDILFWLEKFTLREHFIILIAINLVFWSAMTVWFYSRSPAWNMARKFSLIVLLTFLGSTGIKGYMNANHITGVVLAKRVDVKSEIGNASTTLFQLHAGAPVSIAKEKEGWALIELSGNKRGWVPKEFLGI